MYKEEHFSAHLSSNLLAMLSWLNLIVAPFVIQPYHLHQSYVLIILYIAACCELCRPLWNKLRLFGGTNVSVSEHFPVNIQKTLQKSV